MANRWLQNLTTTPLALRSAFHAGVLAEIEEAITDSERTHTAEIRVAVESALDLSELRRGVSPRGRAEEVFAQLRVWDTAANNGVLVYVLLAERDIEIVADRGFSGRVSDAQWVAICQQLEAEFKNGRYREGCVAAIREIGAHCARHFPFTGTRPNPDELPNVTVLL